MTAPSSTPKEALAKVPQLKRLDHWVALVLVLLTVAAYSQVGTYQFVFDDVLYIEENARTLAGLNRDSLRWAFTCFEDGSYLPLIWLSHAACISIFGPHPGGHHLVNLALHCMNTVLLFLLLRRLTGDLGPSAAVAALFALHPLHVESVAWVSGRKDVLSTLFWLLTTIAYHAYTLRRTLGRYLGMTILFTLGLLCKSMLVSLPLTMLLLDYWPLQRISHDPILSRDNLQRVARLVVEKIPLFLLAILAAAVTYWAQRNVGAMSDPGDLTFGALVANALTSMAKYVGLVFWPLSLSPFYRHPGPNISYFWATLAGLFLLGMTVGSFLQARRRPFVLFGWLWFLVTILPVAGFIQVGAQAHADRYTYVPLVGVFVILAWLVKEFFDRSMVPRLASAALSAALLGTLLTLTAVQSSRWKDTETLFGHTISIDPNNYMAYAHLGLAYRQEKRYPEAIASYIRAVSLNPNHYLLHHNLGDLLERVGFIDGATVSFRKAVELKPRRTLSNFRYAHLLLTKGKFDEALPHLEKVLASDPTLIATDPIHQRDVLQGVHLDLGLIRRSKGDLPGAILCFRKALSLNPQYPLASLRLGVALGEAGYIAEAIPFLEQAVRLNPNSPDHLLHLEEALLRAGKAAEARSIYEQLKATSPESRQTRTGLELLHAGPARRSPEIRGGSRD